MALIWICSKCGTENEPNDARCYSCLRKRTTESLVDSKLVAQPTSRDDCSKCGRPLPDHSNACPSCGAFARPNRLADASSYPSAPSDDAVLCFLPGVAETCICAEPTAEAEILYWCGQGDALAVSAEDGDFYRVILPGNEAGFVLKRDGKLAEFGIGAVREPLGYVRPRPGYAAEVVLVQPGGEKETIHELKDEDRLPVVEERANYYVVQLPSGIRGRVHKARVIRTLQPASLPPEEGPKVGKALGVAAMVGIALLGAAIGAVAEDSGEAKMRRAFSAALRDRGY